LVGREEGQETDSGLLDFSSGGLAGEEDEAGDFDGGAWMLSVKEVWKGSGKSTVVRLGRELFAGDELAGHFAECVCVCVCGNVVVGL
jgi:hypothetical protein